MLLCSDAYTTGSCITGGQGAHLHLHLRIWHILPEQAHKGQGGGHLWVQHMLVQRVDAHAFCLQQIRWGQPGVGILVACAVQNAVNAPNDGAILQAGGKSLSASRQACAILQAGSKSLQDSRQAQGSAASQFVLLATRSARLHMQPPSGCSVLLMVQEQCATLFVKYNRRRWVDGGVRVASQGHGSLQRLLSFPHCVALSAWPQSADWGVSCPELPTARPCRAILCQHPVGVCDHA